MGEEYGLVMPFVVCASNGGPFADDAFVAGCHHGRLDAELGRRPSMVASTVPSALVPQLDLLAMHHGYAFESEPWAEHPDEWTFVTFSRIAEATS